MKVTLSIGGEAVSKEVDRKILSEKMKQNSSAARSVKKRPGEAIDPRITTFSFDKYSVIEAISEDLSTIKKI